MVSFYFTQESTRVLVHIQSDKPVNAWQGSVSLSDNTGRVMIDLASGVSDVWQQAPAQEGGEIVFTGGKTNGFKGDGVLFSFSLQPGTYVLRFSCETSAYLNDGLGTRVASEFPQARFVAEVTEEMSPEATGDNVPPEPFTPALYQQPGFFDEKPVAVWGAQDLQSGISHYEVREVTKSGVIDWHTAQSPYVIHGDVKHIEIKAIDYFGNERVESLKVAGYSFAELFTITLAILAVVVVYTISRWRRSGKKKL